LEWAALDAHTRRRWGAFLRKHHIPLATGQAEVRRLILLDSLGLRARNEAAQAARAGCSVAELRRQRKQLAAEIDADAQPTASAEPGPLGGQPHAL
jgi:hypothetical protein